MKRYIRTIFLLIMLLSVCSCKPAPHQRIKSIFNVDLRGAPYTVEDYNENWCPNGDGEYYVKLSLSSASPEAIQNIKERMLIQEASELPISEVKGIVPSRYTFLFPSFTAGLYLFRQYETDERNYELMIWNEEKKEIIVIVEYY